LLLIFGTAQQPATAPEATPEEEATKKIREFTILSKRHSLCGVPFFYLCNYILNSIS
jgi:hypothetical protein